MSCYSVQQPTNSLEDGQIAKWLAEKFYIQTIQPQLRTVKIRRSFPVAVKISFIHEGKQLASFITARNSFAFKLDLEFTGGIKVPPGRRLLWLESLSFFHPLKETLIVRESSHYTH